MRNALCIKKALGSQLESLSGGEQEGTARRKRCQGVCRRLREKASRTEELWATPESGPRIPHPLPSRTSARLQNFLHPCISPIGAAALPSGPRLSSLRLTPWRDTIMGHQSPRVCCTLDVQGPLRLFSPALRSREQGPPFLPFPATRPSLRSETAPATHGFLASLFHRHLGSSISHLQTLQPLPVTRLQSHWHVFRHLLRQPLGPPGS